MNIILTNRCVINTITLHFLSQCPVKQSFSTARHLVTVPFSGGVGFLERTLMNDTSQQPFWAVRAVLDVVVTERTPTRAVATRPQHGAN